MIILFAIGILFAIIGMAAGARLKYKFKKYSQYSLSSGLTGAEIAAKMLQDHGIMDVKITQVNGQLTDHYNPIDKTVNLSEVVYNERNVAAAAVAAHEVGHAVQHATAYKWIGMRSKMVPMVNISSQVLNYANMAMMFGAGYFIFNGNPFGMVVLQILIVANVFITTFALVTLPVEFDASNRALAWLNNKNMVTRSEHEGAKDALKWAAMTYVVAALAAIANLITYILIFLSNRD